MRPLWRQAFANTLTGVVTIAVLTGILLLVAHDGDDRAAEVKAKSASAVVAVPAVVAGPGASAGWGRRSRQSGAVMTSWWHDNYALPASDQALIALARTGANSVALLTTWYMANSGSSTIAPDPARTPTDSGLMRAIATARRLGLAVVLKPHVNVDTGSPRSSIDPGDPSAWFASYRRMVAHYADLARRTHANMLVIGTELGSLSTRTEDWLSVIRTARQHYHGLLTYAAKFVEATRIQFWRSLDFIGVNAYVPLAKPSMLNPTVRQLVTAWHTFRDQYGKTHHYYDVLATLHRRYRRPVLFPELGYRSRFGIAVQPGFSGGQSTRGAQEPQRRAFEAAYEVWYRVPWFAGIYWWDWRARAFDPTDDGYNPRGKLAEQTMRSWNRRRVAAYRGR